MHRPAIIVGLARLALIESIDPRACPSCHGIKYRVIKQLKIECPACKGTGHNKMSDYQYARCMGINKITWRKWKSRYKNDILPIVDRLDASVRGGLNKRLK